MLACLTYGKRRGDTFGQEPQARTYSNRITLATHNSGPVHEHILTVSDQTIDFQETTVLFTAVPLLYHRIVTSEPTAANIFAIATTGIRPNRRGSTSQHASTRAVLSCGSSHFLHSSSTGQQHCVDTKKSSKTKAGLIALCYISNYIAQQTENATAYTSNELEPWRSDCKTSKSSDDTHA